MEWSDHGVIIAINKHSEESAVVSCLTQKRGLCRGFIKNIRFPIPDFDPCTTPSTLHVYSSDDGDSVWPFTSII